MARRTPTQRAAERRALAQNRADIAGRMVGDIEDAARAGDVAATMLLAADLARLAAAEVTERAGGDDGHGVGWPDDPALDEVVGELLRVALVERVDVVRTHLTVVPPTIADGLGGLDLTGI
jgi:hypothetical protein